MFRKQLVGAPPGFFAWEAAGLDWLRQAGGARIVEVLGVEDDAIELRRIHPVAPTSAAAGSFGRALALTHSAGAPGFGAGPPGWEGPGFIATLPLELRPTERWGEFYAEQRLWPFARRAFAAGDLPELRSIERVCDRLVAGDFDDIDQPARLHGDLWSGNLMFAADGAVLIDPAAHGGHPLTDLAMLSLFGAPYLSQIVAGYRETVGLPENWSDLIGLHQLHPLLVHAELFGAGYGNQAVGVAKRFG